jgi:hypothetical protein
MLGWTRIVAPRGEKGARLILNREVYQCLWNPHGTAWWLEFTSAFVDYATHGPAAPTKFIHTSPLNPLTFQFTIVNKAVYSLLVAVFLLSFRLDATVRFGRHL